MKEKYPDLSLSLNGYTLYFTLMEHLGHIKKLIIERKLQKKSQ